MPAGAAFRLGQIGRAALELTTVPWSPASATRCEPYEPASLTVRADPGIEWSGTTDPSERARSPGHTTGRTGTPAPVRPAPQHDDDAAGLSIDGIDR
jgi:hypothetical protein